MSLADQADRRRGELEDRYRSWWPVTLSELLDRMTAQYPERPFVIGEEAIFSYADVAEWSAGLARGLVGRGMQRGDRVALVMPNGPDAIAARFAVARAGAVAVPISFRLRAIELAEVLRQSQPAALITMEQFREIDALEALDQIMPGWEVPERQPAALPELQFVVTVPAPGARPRRPDVLTLDGLNHDPDPVLDAELAGRAAAACAQDTATIFYTSGTTGHPKGVLSTYDMELRSAYGSAYARAFEDGRRILFALPLNHVFAYAEGLLASMFVGGSVVVQSVFDAQATLAAIERHRAVEALFVPTMSLAVIQAARMSGHDLSSLHSVMSAAQSAPASLWNDLQQVLGVEQCVTAYGMTETSAASTFTRPGGPVDDLVGTVGWPKPGGLAGDPQLEGRLVEYKTVDRVTGAELPPGAEGELAARGPIVSPGYFRQPEATAATMLPGGWLRSGDLGYIRGDGALVLTGRAKDMYKCGGELVTPTEVEACLTRHADIVQAYVVGVPDGRMGEVGCAWIVPNEQAKPSDEEVIAYCRAELARFKVPAYVLLITADRLPLTVSGKVQKFKLAERAITELGLPEATTVQAG
ncbi:MAG: class I adenylate-forming enzyme family protein [Streptosporangiaceae bacterium]